MDLTNSAAEGWRMRSRKSCQASGAVEDPKASAPPSIVAGSGGGTGLGGSDQRVFWFYAEDGGGGGQRLAGSPRMPLATRRFRISILLEFGLAEELPHRSGAHEIGRAHV